jgi:hypothetical protein
MAARPRASALTGGLVGIEVTTGIDDCSSNGGDAIEAESPFAWDIETLRGRGRCSAKAAILRVLWQIGPRNDVV